MTTHPGSDDDVSPDDPTGAATDAARPGESGLSYVERELATRWPEHEIDPTLDRMRAVMDVLGHPERAYPVIHLTGTNGKTSTARMVESLLRTLGLRTGRFTSPHLQSYTERISIDGEPLSPERFAEVFAEVMPYVALIDRDQPVRMSFFEVLTTMGYAAFADAPVDVAVVEVGMGGLWDATNVADGRVAVITPIALDHEKWLGDDLEAIAGEKAGIIKPGATAVLAQQPLEAAETLLRQAVAFEATVAREGLEFGVSSREIAVGGQLITLHGLGGTYDEIFLPLHGAHQAHNAATALAAVEVFLGVGPERAGIDPVAVREAFAAVTSPGRLEVVRRSPTVLLDAAHNPAGAAVTAAAVEEAFSFEHLVGVVAVMADKDARGILEALEPVLDEIVVTQNASRRSLPVDELALVAVDVFGEERVHVHASLVDALDAAVAIAEADREPVGTGVLVTGSVITAGNVRAMVRGTGAVH